MIDFLCRIKILLLKMLKFFKIPGLLVIFVKIQGFFQNFLNPGFSGFFLLLQVLTDFVFNN